MERTDKPMLLLYAAPGVLIPPASAPWYIARIKRIATVYVGLGLHFIQEDQPEAVGRALSAWVRRLDAQLGAWPRAAARRSGEAPTQDANRSVWAVRRSVPSFAKRSEN